MMLKLQVLRARGQDQAAEPFPTTKLRLNLVYINGYSGRSLFHSLFSFVYFIFLFVHVFLQILLSSGKPGGQSYRLFSGV